MKRWSLVVAGLYLLLLAALAVPTLSLGLWRRPDTGMAALLFGSGWTWLVLAALGACQLALLLVPVRIVARRPVTRGAVWPTVLLGAAMMTLLGLAAALSVRAAALGDKREAVWEHVLFAALLVALWAGWSAVFFRLGRERPPADFLSVLCRRLLQGSILELLVAVPCHVVVRCREFCCAGIYTMFGLAMGISVMLFAFGPAVFFLLVARARRLRPPEPDNTPLVD